MARKRYTPEQVIGCLRSAEVMVGSGLQHGISAARDWHDRKYLIIAGLRNNGGMSLDQARNLKDWEQENAQLKCAVADLTLDNLILKEVSKGKF